MWWEEVCEVGVVHMPAAQQSCPRGTADRSVNAVVQDLHTANFFPVVYSSDKPLVEAWHVAWMSGVEVRVLVIN